MTAQVPRSATPLKRMRASAYGLRTGLHTVITADLGELRAALGHDLTGHSG
jgi:hypothetical protein